MKIIDHYICYDNRQRVDFVATPNIGGELDPQYIITHYTAATTASSTINWFQKKEAKASAHLLIDRDGTVTQFAPFNKITWHAGLSNWGVLSSMNKHTIGIELVNGGKLHKYADLWRCPIDKKKIHDSETVLAMHKHERKVEAWHDYTKEQIERLVEVSTLITHKYEIKDVLGHDDISPFRKIDPGPAFPIASVRAHIFGRADEVARQAITTTVLNIREGGGTNYSKIAKALPKGTRVEVIRTEGGWSFVSVLDIVHGNMDLEGWVYNKYLQE